MTPNIFPGSDETRAAIIAHVFNDRLVNLCVIDANGATLSRTSVQLLQGDDPVPPTMHCQWMPYQVGQAAKAEDLEKKLAEK